MGITFRRRRRTSADLDSDPLRELGQRLAERDALDLLVEGENIAALAAAEAMEGAAFGKDDKRRRLLLVEGAKPLERPPCSLQRHVVANELSYICPGPNFGNCVVSHRWLSRNDWLIGDKIDWGEAREQA